MEKHSSHSYVGMEYYLKVLYERGRRDEVVVDISQVSTPYMRRIHGPSTDAHFLLSLAAGDLPPTTIFCVRLPCGVPGSSMRLS